MRITPKQEEEIQWICKHFGNGYIPSKEEKEVYIQNTVHGSHIKQKESEGLGQQTSSQIEEYKRKLDIQIKMWRNDIADGMFHVSEFEELMDGYGDKVFKSIMSNLPPSNPKFVQNIFRNHSIFWANGRWSMKVPIDVEEFMREKTCMQKTLKEESQKI